MTNRVRSTALIGGVAVVAVLLLMVQRGQAQNVASDRAAGYVVFPKVLVDSSDVFSQGRRVDTLLQLTSTAVPSGADSGCRVVKCFYINSTKLCSNSNINGTPKGPCRTNADCYPGGTCATPANCGSERNFFLVLSGSQPVGWSANTGGVVPPDSDKCAADYQSIPAAPEAFFAGEVKCVEVDDAASGTPIYANELKGEATIYNVRPGVPGGVDVRSYNAIGIPATSTSGAAIAHTCVAGSDLGDSCAAEADCHDCGSTSPCCATAMCLGSNGGVCQAATHASCPSTLVLNHLFDEFPVLHTDLTLVPCSEDITVGAPTTVAQFVIFNEFEQRFSASLTVGCFEEIALSNIDTLPGNEAYSIFSANVQGTLTGQTRIRPVTGSELNVGHGLLGVAEEFYQTDGFPQSGASNLNYTGTTPGQADVVVLPPPD